METIKTDIQDSIGIIWLNRPKVKNAFNNIMISEIKTTITSMELNSKVRVIVFAAKSNVFCAGADLNWMKEMSNYDFDKNYNDALGLSELLFMIHTNKKPTLARIHGHSYAGGIGILSACDIAIASFNSNFCLSEVKIGLIPSTIGPYVIRSMGERNASRYMLTGEVFNAAEAYRIGLLHEIAPLEKLDEKVDLVLSHLILSGPKSITECKSFQKSFQE